MFRSRDIQVFLLFIFNHLMIYQICDVMIIGFKRNMQKCNLHYAAISMMTSGILKSVDFTQTQKFRYLENER